MKSTEILILFNQEKFLSYFQILQSQPLFFFQHFLLAHIQGMILRSEFQI